MLSFIKLNVVFLFIVMLIVSVLSIVFFYLYTDSHYAERCYAECRYAECNGTSLYYYCVVQPHADVIKLFSSSLTVGQNKLQCLLLHVLMASLQYGSSPLR
jgi:hypothetical protein